MDKMRELLYRDLIPSQFIVFLSGLQPVISPPPNRQRHYDPRGIEDRRRLIIQEQCACKMKQYVLLSRKRRKAFCVISSAKFLSRRRKHRYLKIRLY